VLLALSRIRDAQAVPDLVDSLPFVPLRPFIADTLGAIGDVRARAPLLALFAEEHYETARPREARALLALGARRDLQPLLERFAGLPEPMLDAIAVAREAKLLDPASGGVSVEYAGVELVARVALPAKAPLRLLVLSAKEGGDLSGSVAGEPLAPGVEAGALHIRELAGPIPPGPLVELRLRDPQGILAAWIVPRTEAPFDLRAADK
jgi:hypothetical protein